MASSQNTVAGTANGSSLIDSRGNWFLEQVDALTNVGVSLTNSIGGAAYSVLDTYGGFRDRLTALGLLKADATKPPMQTMPEGQITSPSDWFSNPANAQKALMVATAISLLGVGAYYVLKKR